MLLDWCLTFTKISSTTSDSIMNYATHLLLGLNWMNYFTTYEIFVHSALLSGQENLMWMWRSSWAHLLQNSDPSLNWCHMDGSHLRPDLRWIQAKCQRFTFLLNTSWLHPVSRWPCSWCIRHQTMCALMQPKNDQKWLSASFKLCVGSRFKT